MLKKLKNWLKKFIDYHIVGEYFETDERGHKHKKYIKKYYIKFKQKEIKKL